MHWRFVSCLVVVDVGGCGVLLVVTSVPVRWMLERLCTVGGGSWLTAGWSADDAS